MKQRIYDDNGHLTEYGKRLYLKVERLVGKFFQNNVKNVALIKELELVFIRAATWESTWYNLKRQAK